MSERLKWLFRLGCFSLVVALIVVAVLSLSVRRYALFNGFSELVQGGDPGLNPAERLFLQTYLSSRTEQLEKPAGDGMTPVTFTVSPGESADQIAANLLSQGLLEDADLFVRYARYHDLDSQLQAGEFVLSPQMTIPELATALTQAFAREVELRFVEGWRLEEMVDYLAENKRAMIDAAEFQAIVQRKRDLDLARYDFLASLPAESSLEGYLFPDTYRVPLDADAAYLVDLMLENFGRRVTPAMRQAFGGHGLSLREAVTLASIVEREAVVAEERPLIAGVFYNRLAQEMKLEADPTAQYALGYQPDSGSWWKSPLTLEDLAVDSPYNTYRVVGLPPGPIANPSLSSLGAVAEPAGGDYLFFVVDCTSDQPGAHVFSKSYEEHLVNVGHCR